MGFCCDPATTKPLSRSVYLLSTLATQESYTTTVDQIKIAIDKKTCPMAANTPASTGSSCSLFVLPPEIRLEVYHHLVISCVADGDLKTIGKLLFSN